MTYEVIFESDRINFVRVSKELVQDYLDMVNDVEVQKFISHNRRVYSLDGELEWIKSKLDNNAIIFSMIEKKTNEFIGNIEIMEINNNIGEVGIAITPKKQNKHFGQEAMKRLIDYAFNELNLDGLELNVYDFNPRGIKCYEKVGFVIDGEGKAKGELHMLLKIQQK